MGSITENLKDKSSERQSYQTTYLTLAEDTFRYVKYGIAQTELSNRIAYNSALIVINYFKYIIDACSNNDDKTIELKTSALRSDNLAKLIHYLQVAMHLEIPAEVRLSATSLYSYYAALDDISQNSFVPSKDEIEFCYNSMLLCRKFALTVVEDLEKELFKEKVKANLNVIRHEDKAYKL